MTYVENYLALNKAIHAAGGNGEWVIHQLAEGLLDTLARNNIKLNPVYLKGSEQSLLELSGNPL